MAYTRYLNSKGYEYYLWEEPVPRISDDYLKSVFYLFKSVDDAVEGSKLGGSGFMIALDCKSYPDKFRHIYAITNKHVVMNRDGTAKATNLRFNNVEGDTDIFTSELKHWHLAPDDDLAALPIFPKASRILARCIGNEQFFDPDKPETKELNIGAGDDVFFVGRFTDHHGKTINTPTVRFGTVAMLSGDEIFDGLTGISQVSYLAEARSLKGFSGSPAFVHQPSWTQRPDVDPNIVGFKPLLLGVVWSHFKSFEPVLDEKGKVVDGWQVEQNSGIMGVIPATRLLRFIMDDEKLKKERVERHKEFKKRLDAEPPISLDSNDEELSKDEFEQTLRKVTRKVDKPKPEK